MVLAVRDTADPNSFVQSWVAENYVSVKLDAFLATLIVYDAGEHLLCRLHHKAESRTSKLSHLTKRYFLD